MGPQAVLHGLIAITPEVVAALAAREHMEARWNLQRVNRDYNYRRKYTLAHAMFAQMGGYVVHYYDDSTVQEAEAEPKSQQRDTDADAETPVAKEAIGARSEALRNAMQNGDGKPSTAHFFFWICQISVRCYTKDSFCCIDTNAREFEAKLEEHGIPFNLDEEDIKDRSKADPFTKAFALLQAGWLVLQSCARKSAGLQITELELMTMAFTVCALVTYLLWRHKPFDAERSAIVSLPMSRYNAIQELLRFADTNMVFTEFRPARYNIDFGWDSFLDMVGDVSYERGRYTRASVSSLIFYVFGAIFSAIHFVAWNWVFPVPIVQTLWRSFCCTALGSAILPPIVIWLYITLPPDDWISWIAFSILATLFVMNIISRLALIGLTFYCFTSMPASAYQDLDWTLFLPHFS